MMQGHHWLGVFTLLTLVLAGVAIGRVLKLPNGEGIYLTVFAAALISWWIGRRSNRKKGQS
jgi:Ni,Fe-hydrogenase I cytochrome b subunit